MPKLIKNLSWLIPLLAAVASAQITNIPQNTGNLVVGTTVITGATNGYCLYNNAGILANQSCSAATLSIGSGITGSTSGYVLYVNSSLQLAQEATLSAAQFPTLTGDVSNSGLATTVVAINGASVPASAKLLGSNSSSQAIAAALTSAHLYVGNGSNLPVDVAVSGDLTLANTGAFTVTQVEGAAIPASAVAVATNSSKQLIAATTSGTGSTLALTGSPTFTGTVGGASLTLSTTLTLSAISGSTQCLHVNSSGVVSGTGSDCGSGGGGGTVTSSGSPVSGNVAAFSTATNIVPATSANVYGLWSGTCSSTTFLRGDGACAAPSGSGTVNSGTSGHLAYYASSTNAVSSDSALDDGATNANGLTYTGSAGLYAASFTGTGSNPYINFPSNTSHTGAAGDLWNDAGVLLFGSTPVQLITSGGDINTSNQVTVTHLAAALPVAQGGTNCTTASITCFNNITGYTASGATGTTSTSLVFSGGPALSVAGTFNNSAWTNGGSSVTNSAVPVTIYQLVQGSNYDAPGLAGATVVGSGSTNLTGSGLIGLAENSSTTTLASGVSGYGYAPVQSVTVNGGTFIAESATGLTSGATLYGLNVVVNSQNANDTTRGINVSGTSTNGSNRGIAFNVQALGSSLEWATGFNCNKGSVATACLSIGPVSSSNNVNSQIVQFTSTDSGGTAHTAYVATLPAGAWVVTPDVANNSNTFEVDQTGNVIVSAGNITATAGNLLGVLVEAKGSSTGYSRIASGLSGSTSYTYTIPSTSAADTFCLLTSANCGTLVSPTSGTSVSLTSAVPQMFVCTSTCTVTVPVPAAGAQYCVYNDDNVSTVITLSAIGSSARYENTARTAYGTAGTGTFVSGGAVGDAVCIVYRDSTHYSTLSHVGTWTAN